MKAAAVRKVQCGRRPLGFTQVLQVLDGRLQKLDHQPEERKRLQEAVEVLAMMLELVEQLQVRCLEVRGLIGLKAAVD